MKKLTSQRNKIIAEQFRKGVSGEKIMKEHEIGLTYLRSILSKQGLIDTKPNKKNIDKRKRNIKIGKLFKNGKTPAAIATEMKLTTSRILQILNKSNIDVTRKNKLLEDKEKALTSIAEGKTAKEIANVIGAQSVKLLKYRFNFSVFKLVTKRKAERVVELYNQGMKPIDIAQKLKSTPDYIYMLLRKAGLMLKELRDSKPNRNKAIYDFIENKGSVTQAAKNWKLSKETIRSIHERISRQPVVKG